MSTLPKAVSLFSGCGGFDLGIQRCGVEIIWANDIDASAAVAYQSVFPDVEFVHDDIHSIKLFPAADILIGCYPCTGFSQAAKRRWKGREDRDLTENPKNFLFKQFLRAIRQVSPKFIFIENVKGMISASNGSFFSEQLAGLKELGFSAKYKVLDASDYGVAQSRERLFIVGVHESVGDFEYNFPTPTHGVNGVKKASLKDVISGMPIWPTAEFLETKFHGHYLTRNRKRRWIEPSYTIVANADHVPLHPKGKPMMYVDKDKWALQGEFNRRLSYKECLKIQGLPLTMALPESLNRKYMVAGNAVPPRLAEVVGKPIGHYLTQLI